MITPSPTLAQPTFEHIGVHRMWARFATNEEIHAAMDTARWLLQADTDGDYPADVCENSRLNQQALITACEMELAYRLDRGLSRPPVPLGIPRELMDDLKARVRLEDEIGLVRPVRKSGATYRAICPFHDDHRPSLVIWPDSQRWKCYPCNLGGDVFTWVQMWMPTDFRGAVDYLSARAGVPVAAAPPARATGATDFQYGRYRRRTGAPR